MYIGYPYVFFTPSQTPKAAFGQIPKEPLKIQSYAEERVELFITDRFSPLLNFHGLRGEYVDCYSINVNADFCIIFYLSDDTMHLICIGTHSQLLDDQLPFTI
jgi:mRNA-degrading endonuclease YafQ of YafQ-DinJ toxin-antitoxin module